MFVNFQVQIRPWNLSDSDFVMDGSQPLDPRKTIFVGGVPRPLRAGRNVATFSLCGLAIVRIVFFFQNVTLILITCGCKSEIRGIL